MKRNVLAAVAAFALSCGGQPDASSTPKPTPVVTPPAPTPTVVGTAGSDVLGWGRTRWGMNREALTALFPGATEKKEQATSETAKKGTSQTKSSAREQSELDLARINISGRTYRASCGLDDDRGLLYVSLVPDVQKLGYAEAAGIFSSLESDLLEKYGPPRVSENGTVTKRIWRFPSTRLQLMFTGLATMNHGGIVLTYSKPDPETPDGL